MQDHDYAVLITMFLVRKDVCTCVQEANEKCEHKYIVLFELGSDVDYDIVHFSFTHSENIYVAKLRLCLFAVTRRYKYYVLFDVAAKSITVSSVAT